MEDLEVRVSRKLRLFGIPVSLAGYNSAKKAIIWLYESEKTSSEISMTKQLYPAVAMLTGSTAARVERQIRHAVTHVFDECDMDLLNESFGNTISIHSGKLTNAEFLWGIVEILRMEDIQNEAC